MNIETLIQQNLVIVYDQDVIPDPSEKLFEVGHWRASESIVGSAPGRGTAFFIETPFGAAVLRQYWRGGWAARFSQDRYLYIGYRRSRPFREFQLLAHMADDGLPVPRPLAAICHKHGLLYGGGAMLTRTIPHVKSLASLLHQGMDAHAWARIGACIRRFHDAGVHHADLNARNILLQEAGDAVYLLDFDRGSMTPGVAVNGHRNLARLRRSLQKLWPSQTGHELERCWNQLIEGYGV